MAGEVNGNGGWILPDGEGAHTVKPGEVGHWPWETVNGVPFYRRWLFLRVIDWDFLAGLWRRAAGAWAWVQDPAGQARAGRTTTLAGAVAVVLVTWALATVVLRLIGAGPRRAGG
ncbi:MAG: hypothetical protein Q8N53_18780 [Longimicrobiales bacterium]|nr:hypothetical protein [Longimicrobiales bacterium]